MIKVSWNFILFNKPRHYALKTHVALTTNLNVSSFSSIKPWEYGNIPTSKEGMLYFST